MTLYISNSLCTLFCGPAVIGYQFLRDLVVANCKSIEKHPKESSKAENKTSALSSGNDAEAGERNGKPQPSGAILELRAVLAPSVPEKKNMGKWLGSSI